MSPSRHHAPDSLGSLRPGTLAEACRGSLLEQARKAPTELAADSPELLRAICQLDRQGIDAALVAVHDELAESRTHGAHLPEPRAFEQSFRASFSHAEALVMRALDRAVHHSGPAPTGATELPVDDAEPHCAADADAAATDGPLPALRTTIETMDRIFAGSGERLLAEVLLQWVAEDDWLGAIPEARWPCT